MIPAHGDKSTWWLWHLIGLSAGHYHDKLLWYDYHVSTLLYTWLHWAGLIDGFAQDCSNSSALALELLQSCAKTSVLATTPSHQQNMHDFADGCKNMKISLLISFAVCPICVQGSIFKMFSTSPGHHYVSLALSSWYVLNGLIHNNSALVQTVMAWCQFVHWPLKNDLWFQNNNVLICMFEQIK